MKTSIFHLRILFCTCVLQKNTAHVGTKALIMHHQSQKGFGSIFVGIPQHQKGYIVNVPHKRKIVSSHNVVFDENLSSALAYTSQPYAEAMAMRPSVSYIPYATSSKEKTENIITFAQFEEGGLISKTCNNTESGN